ncbi:MAG: hypothetical protein WCC82_05290, partial [Nitrososphaeraceae archaeon]
MVDINTAEYGKNTRRLIDLLKEKNIPLILTSAKTRLEQNMVRKDLGLTDPYIIENGGAVVIPKGYFSDSALRDIEYPLREMEEVENEGAYTNDEESRNLADSEQTSTIHDNRTRTTK